jgi:hypothetical protein
MPGDRPLYKRGVVLGLRRGTIRSATLSAAVVVKLSVGVAWSAAMSMNMDGAVALMGVVRGVALVGVVVQTRNG